MRLSLLLLVPAALAAQPAPGDTIRLDLGSRDVDASCFQPHAAKVRVYVKAVNGEDDVNVEGTMVRAWKVEERRQSDRILTATWWLLPKSPYMVYGEVPLADGSIQRMTEVAVPMPNQP